MHTSRNNDMRTILFLTSGILLVSASALLARLFSSELPSAPFWATVAFCLIWLLICGGNMWVGVAKAGYSVAEELPILLILYGVPALAAVLLKWKLL